MVAQPGRDGDYCLTTSLSGLSFCVTFHALTFFSRHSNQRRNLRTLYKFPRCIIAYRRMSQFQELADGESAALVIQLWQSSLEDNQITSTSDIQDIELKFEIKEGYTTLEEPVITITIDG